MPDCVDDAATEINECLKKAEFSLLGLGDIVMTGVFIALLMRYDAVNAKVDPREAEYKTFPKPFFFSNLVAYALGLYTTVFVMYYFNHAQPALLYLVPACLGASLIVALAKGKFQHLCNYSEDDQATDSKKD